MSQQLQITIERDAPTPLREQLRRDIRQKIETGVLQPGTRLPSTRSLAADLRLARSVVVDAYQQLAAEGYLTPVNRSGTRVADLAAVASPTEDSGLDASAEAGPAIRWDLRTGRPDVTGFPRSEWLACLQRVVRDASWAQLEYPHRAGVPELRAELAAYLGRVRAVRTAPDNVMVTAGFAQGLSLLCHLLREHGHTTIAVEDPGHPGERHFIEGTGLLPVPVAVDEEGIDVEALAGTGCRAVLVTPAHQFPTGVVLAPRRRAALLDWARRVDGLVIEDDYDGEFWFGGAGRPPSLQGLAPELVAYGGSSSKALAPGLRFGWLTVPPALMPALEQVRSWHDLGLSTLDQYAYSVLIHSGRLDRHLRRINKRYQERRDTLVQALAEGLPEARVTGPAAGLHSFVALPEGIDEMAVVRAAQQRGVLVRGAGYFAYARPPRAAGLVVGYATQPPDALVAAVAALTQAARGVGAPYN